MGTFQRVSPKNIAILLGGVVLGAVIVLVSAMWAEKLVPAFRARQARKARNAPMIEQAGKLGLTYDSVLADPERAVGKPAVWCLTKMTPWKMLYQGSEGKPVYIENPHGMSKVIGQAQDQTCTDTLLTIKSVTTLDFGTVRGLRLEASFVDYP